MSLGLKHRIATELFGIAFLSYLIISFSTFCVLTVFLDLPRINIVMASMFGTKLWGQKHKI